MDFADFWGFPAVAIVGANSASGETSAIRLYGNANVSSRKHLTAREHQRRRPFFISIVDSADYKISRVFGFVRESDKPMRFRNTRQTNLIGFFILALA